MAEIDAGGIRIAPQQHAEWLTVSEVAKHFRVSPRSVSRWAQTGELRIKRIGPSGRLIRIHHSVLDSELNSANDSAVA